MDRLQSIYKQLMPANKCPVTSEPLQSWNYILKYTSSVLYVLYIDVSLLKLKLRLNVVSVFNFKLNARKNKTPQEGLLKYFYIQSVFLNDWGALIALTPRPARC